MLFANSNVARLEKVISSVSINVLSGPRPGKKLLVLDIGKRKRRKKLRASGVCSHSVCVYVSIF